MDLLREALTLFGDVPRPEHFTDYRHCCECAEHDEFLRGQTLQSLSADLLQAGWDPLCFITPQGFQYFFPALARLALEGRGESYFIDQMLFHLELDGPGNARFRQFTPAQRAFVVGLLHHFVETRAEEIDNNLDTDRLFRTLEIWSAGA